MHAGAAAIAALSILLLVARRCAARPTVRPGSFVAGSAADRTAGSP